jgi:L-arabinose isomerase
MNAMNYQFWFVTGSQPLYGPEILNQVRDQAKHVVQAMTDLPYAVLDRGVVTDADAIRQVFLAANADDACAGVIVWMHTFSPAQRWIAGLTVNQRPLLHWHTQFHREIPWDTIDMDFMNLNQAAHGDREFGFINTRMKIPRKVVVGHWQDVATKNRIGAWMRVAAGFHASHHLRLARFGDNMRHVAVTEGDKVEAGIRLGWTVEGFGVGDLAARVRAVSDQAIDREMERYQTRYVLPERVRQDPRQWAQVRGQARIESALRAFLEEGQFSAFTTTFEDLHGLDQLPGLAAQDLMAEGYGFGAEGDWKTAGLVRVLKVIAGGQATSFMEDYTYHLVPGQERILGAHMLEVCPTIAAAPPEIQVHPLTIGGKSDPARLVFDGRAGAALTASLIDLGHRFRLVVNQVEAVAPEHPMPNLPVGRVLWRPYPSLTEAAEAWIYAGGAHHTVLSYAISVEQLEDLASLLKVESIVIGERTSVAEIRQQLQWGEQVWR